MSQNAPNDKDCKDIKAMLSPLLDGTLSDAQRHGAERHLADCSTCRELISNAERQDALLAAAIEDGTGALPAGFEEAVLARTVHAEESPRRLSAWLGWFAAAAVILISITMRLVDDAPAPMPSPTDPEIVRAAYPVGPEVRAWALDALPEAVAASPAPESQDEKRHVINEVADYSGRTPWVDPVQGVLGRDPMRPAPPVRLVSRDSADALEQTSEALSMLREADDRSFVDVERVRQIAEYDNLLTRLADARDELPVSDKPVVLAAESMIYRVVRGPLSLDDLRELRHTIMTMDLPGQIDALAVRAPAASSL